MHLSGQGRIQIPSQRFGCWRRGKCPREKRGIMSELCNLNVGGGFFTTSKATLMKVTCWLDFADPERRVRSGAICLQGNRFRQLRKVAVAAEGALLLLDLQLSEQHVPERRLRAEHCRTTPVSPFCRTLTPCWLGCSPLHGAATRPMLRCGVVAPAGQSTAWHRILQLRHSAEAHKSP